VATCKAVPLREGYNVNNEVTADSHVGTMERPLNGRRVLVIGGGGAANGSAITRALAKGGAGVAIADLDMDRASDLRDEVNAAGGTALAVPVDVRSDETIDAAVGAAVDGLGGLDGLVTVVGGHTLFAPWKPLHETSDQEWDLVIDVNLRYVFRAVRASVRQFLAGGTGGSIVSVGSISGERSSPRAAAYGAAKAGLANLARSVAVEYAREGIRMNIVACGVIATEAARIVYEQNAGIADRVPVGRPGDPMEVGQVVSFLLSNAASYVTGQSLVADGGLLSRFPLPVPGAPAHLAG
jgi:3-oxoacyl-[acyl-carrier protein] reductase